MKLFLVLAAALGLLVVFSRDASRNEREEVQIEAPAIVNPNPTPAPVKMKGTSLDKPYNEDNCPHSGPSNSSGFRSTMLDHKNTYNAPETYVSPLERKPKGR